MTSLLLKFLAEIDDGDLKEQTKNRLKLMLCEIWRDGYDFGYTRGAVTGAEFRREGLS